MKTLFKTTIVIWTEEDPTDGAELVALARRARDGNAYCSKQVATKVEDPLSDPDWDNTEFFDDPTEDEESA